MLTPEEWVRQHVVNYLIAHLQYPRSLIRVEGGLTYNQLAKRSDIVVYDRDGAPWMVVECKAPSEKLTQHVIHQAAMYNAKLSARYIAVSNGLAHRVCEVGAGSVIFLETMPAYRGETPS